MWLRIRIAILLLGAGLGFAYVPMGLALPRTTHEVSLHIRIVGFACCILMIPLFLLLLGKLQSKNPFSRYFWKKPDWRGGFFFGPLSFFHFGGWLLIANGVGSAIGGVLFEKSILPGLGGLVLGTAVLISVKVTTWVYRGRFQSGDNRGEG